jgi:hypothetical protein
MGIGPFGCFFVYKSCVISLSFCDMSNHPRLQVDAALKSVFIIVMISHIAYDFEGVLLCLFQSAISTLQIYLN